MVGVQITTHLGASDKTSVPRCTLMCYSQTIGKSPSTTLAWARRYGKNTVRTLGSLPSSTREDRICDWELKIFMSGLTCPALWNGVEGVSHRNLFSIVLTGIESFAGFR